MTLHIIISPHAPTILEASPHLLPNNNKVAIFRYKNKPIPIGATKYIIKLCIFKKAFLYFSGLFFSLDNVDSKTGLIDAEIIPIID